MIRLRFHYDKQEGLRYTGSLDMQRIWERGLRRAGLPVAYTQGFHPQPRIQQACPLPLGFLSTAEIVDVWLESEDIDPTSTLQALCGNLPAGVAIQSVEVVELNGPALQATTREAGYQIELLDQTDQESLRTQMERVLMAARLPRIRRGKEYDLRPLIISLELREQPGGMYPSILMRLSASEGATGRPEEVLQEMGIDPTASRITRTAIAFHTQPAGV